MRAITFQLNISLGTGCSYQLIPRKTLREDDLLNICQFDRLVYFIKQLGCEYRLVRLVPSEPIEGNASFEVP